MYLPRKKIKKIENLNLLRITSPNDTNFYDGFLFLSLISVSILFATS